MSAYQSYPIDGLWNSSQSTKQEPSDDSLWNMYPIVTHDYPLHHVDVKVANYPTGHITPDTWHGGLFLPGRVPGIEQFDNLTPPPFIDILEPKPQSFAEHLDNCFESYNTFQSRSEWSSVDLYNNPASPFTNTPSDSSCSISPAPRASNQSTGTWDDIPRCATSFYDPATTAGPHGSVNDINQDTYSALRLDTQASSISGTGQNVDAGVLGPLTHADASYAQGSPSPKHYQANSTQDQYNQIYPLSPFTDGDLKYPHGHVFSYHPLSKLWPDGNTFQTRVIAAQKDPDISESSTVVVAPQLLAPEVTYSTDPWAISSSSEDLKIFCTEKTTNATETNLPPTADATIRGIQHLPTFLSSSASSSPALSQLRLRQRTKHSALTSNEISGPGVTRTPRKQGQNRKAKTALPRKPDSKPTARQVYRKHGASSSTLKCQVDGCDISCYDKRTLKRHERTHTRSTQDRWHCPGAIFPDHPCADHGYSRADSLLRHLRGVDILSPCALEAFRLGWSPDDRASINKLWNCHV